MYPWPRYPRNTAANDNQVCESINIIVPEYVLGVSMDGGIIVRGNEPIGVLLKNYTETSAVVSWRSPRSFPPLEVPKIGEKLHPFPEYPAGRHGQRTWRESLGAEKRCRPMLPTDARDSGLKTGLHPSLRISSPCGSSATNTRPLHRTSALSASAAPCWIPLIKELGCQLRYRSSWVPWNNGP